MLTLHYNCVAGLSGDMNLGLMIDLGVEPAALEKELRKLNLDGWQLVVEKDSRSGIGGTRVDVILPPPAHNHSHDHSHSHSHDHSHSHTHSHSHDHSHDHSHSHTHHHEHRAYREIRDMIQSAPLSERAKRDSLKIFELIANAEGKVHGKDPLDIHFHEVGAVDSIVDVVGAAICWDLLGIDRVTSSTIELGGGFVNCAHGRMPVPAPATALILAGRPVSAGATNKEATTPTGAAILAAGAAAFNPAQSGTLLRSGFGIGHRQDPSIPNVVQGILYQGDPQPHNLDTDEVWELAVNLDDQSPEAIAHLCERALAAGALDAWQTPATFKKGRLGAVVHLLAAVSERQSLAELLLRESASLGVRQRPWSRLKLRRAIRTVDTPWGPIRVKDAYLGEDLLRSKPEYDDCHRIALEQKIPITDVIQAALSQ